MSQFLPFDAEVLHHWLPEVAYQQYRELAMARVGMTRRRADCFLRLWLYLFLKEKHQQKALPEPPLQNLDFPTG
jgi:hypothetical protein